MQLLAIFAMVVGLGSVMFALQNNVPVTVTFLLWRFDGSLAMVLLLAIALGGVIVGLISTPATLRRQWAVHRLNKQIAQLEADKRDLQQQLERLRGDQARIVAAPAGEVLPSTAESSPKPAGLRQFFSGQPADEVKTGHD